MAGEQSGSLDAVRGSMDQVREPNIRACARCRFAVRFIPLGQIQSQLQCRWGPPAVIVLMGPGKAAGQVNMNIVSIPPPLPEAHWCHQFIPLPEGMTVPIESANVQNTVTLTP